MSKTILFQVIIMKQPVKQINIVEYRSKVEKIAKKQYYKYSCATSGIEEQDLIQEGFKGLCDAYKKFKPEKNVDFWSYAKKRVQGDIIDYLRKAQVINASQKRKNKLKELKTEFNKLSHQLGRQPDDDELSKAMRCPISEIHKIRQNEVFLETVDSFPFETTKTDDFMTDKIKDEIFLDMAECIEYLSSNEERLILLGRVVENVSLHNLAKSLGVSHQTISRKEKAILLKLRDCMNKKEHPFEDIQFVL